MLHANHLNIIWAGTSDCFWLKTSSALPIASFRPFWHYFKQFFTSNQPPKIETLIEFHKQIKGKKHVPSHSILIHSGHVQVLQKDIHAMIRRVSSVVSNADNPEIPTTWSARTPTSVPMRLGLASATPFGRLLVKLLVFFLSIFRITQ